MPRLPVMDHDICVLVNGGTEDSPFAIMEVVSRVIGPSPKKADP
jgi:hypothetical protein